MTWKAPQSSRLHAGALRGAAQERPLTLLSHLPDRLPEPAARWPLPLPGPPAGLGGDLPRVGPHLGHTAAGRHRLCHQHLAAGESLREQQALGARTEPVLKRGAASLGTPEFSRAGAGTFSVGWM